MLVRVEPEARWREGKKKKKKKEEESCGRGRGLVQEGKNGGAARKGNSCDCSVYKCRGVIL